MSQLIIKLISFLNGIPIESKTRNFFEFEYI